MRRALAALLLVALAGCDDGPGGDDVKLGRRSRDAGPAVIIVDRSDRGPASAIPEKEPNEAATGGQLLAVPGAVKGRIDADGDRDVYQLNLPVAGALRVSLSGVDDADLVLELRQPGGELIAASDNGPAKVAEGFPNLFVQPGRLDVVVFEYRKPPPKATKGKKPVKAPAAPAAAARTAPSQPYVLEVRLGASPGPGEEREPNSESAFADELALGATGRGYVGWKRDVDMWRVPLEGVREDEALLVDVDAVEGVALKVTLQDGTGKAILERKGKSGQGVALRSVAIPEKSTLLFVAVTGDRPNDAETYAIRASTAPLVLDEETEPNDTPPAASPLADVPGAASGTRVGTLVAGDVDLFRLDPADVPRQLSVTFTPPAGIDGALAVVGDDGQTVLAAPADAGRAGAEERLAQVAIPAGRGALVKLSGKAGDAAERYRLRWSVVETAAPAAPAEGGVPGIDD